MTTCLCFSSCTTDKNKDLEAEPEMDSVPEETKTADAQVVVDISGLSPVPRLPKDLKPRPNFKELPAGQQRKQAFINYMTPMVHQLNAAIMKRRKLAMELFNLSQLTESQQQWLSKLAKHYRINSFDPALEAHRQQLLNRLDKVPTSLVIAQSANETAWGTSRFATEGNNFFGLWCFQPGCGIVPKRRPEGDIHEVQAFNHPYQSLMTYTHSLNTQGAYKGFRIIRNAARIANQPLSGVILAEGLADYSARAKDYIVEIQKMIQYNKLEQLNVAY